MNEEVKKFVIKKGIKTGDAEIDAYIESLHEYLINFETSNIKKLILSIDRLAGAIADDIDKIVDGESEYEKEVLLEYDEDGEPVYETKHLSNLKVLSDYKDSKVYDRVIALLGRVPSFQLVAQTARGLIPEVEEYTEKTEEAQMVENIKLSGSGNSFEEMQDKHYNKRAGKGVV